MSGGRSSPWSRPDRLRRRAVRLTARGSVPALAAGALALGLLGWLSFEAGGYFEATSMAATAVALAGLGLVVGLWVPHWRLSRSALAAIGCLLGLAAWTGLSAAWSPDPDGAAVALDRTLLYAALLGLGLVFAGSGRQARLVPWCVLVLVLVVCGAGLLSRLQPDVLASADGPAYRLGWPLTYWNAFGALAALGFVLALGLSADPRAAVPLRATSAGVAVLLAVAGYLSLSRGAWVAAIAGLLVLVALGAHRGSLAWTLGLVLGASALAVVRLRGYDALVERPGAGRGQEAEGDAYLPQLLAIAGLVVAAQGLVAAGRASGAVVAASRRVLRPPALGALAVAAVAAVALYAADSDRVEGEAARRTSDASDWVSRQWQEVLRPTVFSESGSARLTSARGTRSELFRVAWRGFVEHPLHGEGAGAFEGRWFRERRVAESVRNAHSLELETLSELGLVGGGLLLGLLGAIAAATVRSRVRPGGLGRSQTAAVGGAVAVWVVHSAIDWDWQMPALTGTALVLSAAVFPQGRVLRRRRPRGTADGARARGTVGRSQRPASSAAPPTAGPG